MLRPIVMIRTTMQYGKPIVVFRPGKDINSIKLCKKCRYFETAGQRCKLFGNINIVDGTLDLSFAAIERSLLGQCGPEAKYWENIIGEGKLYDKLTSMQYKTLTQLVEESENNYKGYWSDNENDNENDSDNEFYKIIHWD